MRESPRHKPWAYPFAAIDFRLAEYPLPSPGERVARRKPGRVWDGVHTKFILSLWLCGICQIIDRHPSSVSSSASHLPPGEGMGLAVIVS